MEFSFEQTDKFSTGSLITRVTNDITQLQISQLILNFEFDETVNMVGAEPELTLDLF